MCFFSPIFLLKDPAGVFSSHLITIHKHMRENDSDHTVGQIHFSIHDFNPFEKIIRAFKKNFFFSARFFFH